MLWCTEKVWRWRIGGITSWKLMSGISWTCKIIRSWSYNSFKTFENIRTDSKSRTLGSVWVEVRRPEMVFCHLWTAASLAEKESFLYHIMISDEKWIHYDNLMHRRLWGKPGHASTSMAKPNIHGSKILLCNWWDQLSVVYYELLKPTETIIGDHYWQQMMCLSWALKKKWLLYNQGQDKMILQHDKARPHVAKWGKTYWETLKWEVLPNCHIHQTLPCSIIICSDWWHTAWLNLIKIKKNGLTRG